ncbi:hypothetical protein CW304_30175 [Bacillus sp. UFRGS-B20]|nr:hypothetical protein CW304_30175 [Bacillus sp. UFRGS-B20]
MISFLNNIGGLLLVFLAVNFPNLIYHQTVHGVQPDYCPPLTDRRHLCNSYSSKFPSVSTQLLLFQHHSISVPSANFCNIKTPIHFHSMHTNFP